MNNSARNNRLIYFNPITFNQWVTGSNPVRLTTNIDDLASFLQKLLSFWVPSGCQKLVLASVLIWISHFRLLRLPQRFLVCKQHIIPICLKRNQRRSSCDIRSSRIQDQLVVDQRPQWRLDLKSQYAKQCWLYLR